MPATYEKIATTTLGSATTSITFSSIPGTYTDLRLVIVNQVSAGAQSIAIRFNSDTGTNYSTTWLTGDGASASSSRTTSLTSLSGMRARSENIGFGTMDIFSYAGSTKKTSLITSSNDLNGSGEIYTIVGLWNSTSAITNIELFVSSRNFNIGTTATLYGILKA